MIIIDAQNEYKSGALKTVGVEASHANIKSLLQAYRGASGDVVHILHETPEGAPVFTPGKDVSKEMDGLEPKDGEKVRR